MRSVSRRHDRSITAELKTITATVNPGASQVVVAQQPTVDFVGDPSTISNVLTTASARAGHRRRRKRLGDLDDHRERPRLERQRRRSARSWSWPRAGSNNTLVQTRPHGAVSVVASRHDRSIRPRRRSSPRRSTRGAGPARVAQQPTVDFVADASNISAVLSTSSASPGERS
jgi:hypothetical protein